MFHYSDYYLEFFLKALGCTRVCTPSFSEKIISNEAIIGFDCEDIDLVKQLLVKLELIDPNRSRRSNLIESTGPITSVGSNHVLILSRAKVDALLLNHLRHMVKETDALKLKDYPCEYWGHGYYFADVADYDRHGMSQDAITAGQKVGLARGETQATEIYHPHLSSGGYAISGFVERVPRKGFVVIEKMRLFFAAHGQLIVDELKLEIQKARISMGLSTFASLIQPKDTGEVKLTSIVGDFLRKSHQDPTPAKPMDDEQPTANIPVIQRMIDTLKRESCSCFCFFTSRKQNKIDFLQKILFFKEANPAFSTKKCIELARDNYRALFQAAMEGYFSSRTRDFVERELKAPGF